LSTAASAQLSFGGEPWARERAGEVPVVTFHGVDVEAMLAEDAARAADGNKRLRFGKNHAADLTLGNSGLWETFPNGDRVWRLTLVCPNAYSVNFEFNTYVVPEGGQVFVYTPTGEALGAFTAESNKGYTELGVGLLPGERITIEYDEPAAVAGQGQLRIGQVTHGYRDNFAAMRGFNASLSCNNNVICPLWDPWRDQIRSVARIIVAGSDWCTGTLLNNCAQDATPYFLTANHCLGGNTGTWLFVFNWESSQCNNNINTPMNQTVSGAQLLESSGGSDVALLELNNAVPPAFAPYFSGWNANNTAPTEQTGIHHPSGDQKKISANSGTSIIAPFNAATCWEVNAWDDGTTEGGSSGSGLWDQNGLIVGQLNGGTFGCNCTDYYGRFNVSFPLLDEWLGDCGPILQGYDPASVSVAEAAMDQAVLHAWPNPGDGRLQVAFPEQVTGPAIVQVMDAVGRIIHMQRTVVNAAPLSMDLSVLAEGAYVLRADVDGRVMQQRIVVQH
jgi:lysyl endopeptidase